MTNRLDALEDWAAGLVGQLEPESRKKLARSIGRDLRRSQQQRIIAQQNPDGSKYAPRKNPNLRRKKGRVKLKLKMFEKLRLARLFRFQGNENAISVGFAGRVARIASVHQHGSKDRAAKEAPVVKYRKREILGFTDSDLTVIHKHLINHISPANP
ncbi:phage virion morphogenesis protein [Pseudomonas koreensis]|uniref:phage virion morphogenesis protein n=1 Tax=Pseudomonas koreensis TaxID=198620 RepID=UPI003D98F8BE